MIKILKAKTVNPRKQVFQITDLTYIKSMNPLKELLDGETMNDPIEVIKHKISPTDRVGANGIPYIEKEYGVHKGSQRMQAALVLGYTHIEGIIVNE